MPEVPTLNEIHVALARFDYGVRLMDRDVDVLNWLTSSLDASIEAVLEEEDELKAG